MIPSRAAALALIARVAYFPFLEPATRLARMEGDHDIGTRLKRERTMDFPTFPKSRACPGHRSERVIAEAKAVQKRGRRRVWLLASLIDSSPPGCQGALAETG